MGKLRVSGLGRGRGTRSSGDTKGRNRPSFEGWDMTIKGKAQLRPLAPRQEVDMGLNLLQNLFFSYAQRDQMDLMKIWLRNRFSLLKQHPRISLQGHRLYRSSEQRGCGGKALLGRCCLRTYPAQPNHLGPSSSPTELWQPWRQDHLIQLDVEIELKGLS